MSILKAFNNHFIEFLDDVLNVFPDDKNIKTGLVQGTRPVLVKQKKNNKCHIRYIRPNNDNINQYIVGVDEAGA